MVEDVLKLLSSKSFRPSKRFIMECFHSLNSEIFDDTIKAFKQIKWISSNHEYFGRCSGEVTKGRKIRYCNLEISAQFPSMMIFFTTLIHEMVHAHQWQHEGQMGHGMTFYKWKEKIENFHFPLEERIGKDWTITTS